MHLNRHEPLRVFLLDDHALVRRGIRDLLSAARDIEVVGEGDSAKTAAELILGLGVEVMVLDLNLQDGTGVHVCRDVRSADPRIKGLLLTAADEDEAAMATVLAGASGYSVKMARSSDILGHVRAIGAGRELIDAAFGKQLVAHLDEVRPSLTSHQRRVAALVAEGLTNAEIATTLGLDEPRVGHDVDLVIAATTGLTRTPAAAQPSAPGRHVRPRG